MKNTAIIKMHCPDKKGIIAEVTRFVQENGGNILYLDQHVNRVEQLFYMRVEWDMNGFAISEDKVADYFDTLIAQKFDVTWDIQFSSKKPRMAVFVSTQSHCLYDILSRYRSGEWNVEIPLVISNHKELEEDVKNFNIPFHYIPITKDTKQEQEVKQIALLKEYDIDFMVLARYMQVLSDNFVSEFPNRIINIHHSFLPAFIGAKPYHAAHNRGVKIIGATSHYVTASLDAGPIIDQDVVRVTHHDSIDSLIRKGRDMEKIVLSRAIYKHLRSKVLVYNNRTVIFS